MTEEIIIGVSVMVASGIIGTVARHITNDDRHVNKGEIVFKDVYEAKHQALQENLQDRLTVIDSKVDELKIDFRESCKEIKMMIKNGNSK